jgi:hypothetical protein
MDDETFSLSQAATELLNARDMLTKAEASLRRAFVNLVEPSKQRHIESAQELGSNVDALWQAVDSLLVL